MNCEKLLQEKTYNKLASKSYFGYYEIFSRKFLADQLADTNSQFIWIICKPRTNKTKRETTNYKRRS